MKTPTGIVNCSVYRNGIKLDDLTVDAISDVLKEADTFVWVGLLEPDQELMRKIQEEFGLHELAVEDAENATSGRSLKSTGIRFSSCSTRQCLSTTTFSLEKLMFL
jgi:magnesium transporter